MASASGPPSASSSPPPDWDRVLPVEDAATNYNAALLSLLTVSAIARQAPITPAPGDATLIVPLAGQERLRALDPYRAGVAAAAAAARRLVCAGATPLHLILSLPEARPASPDDVASWEQYRAGLVAACTGLEIAVLDESAEAASAPEGSSLSPSSVARLVGRWEDGAPPVSPAWPEGATLLLLQPPFSHPAPRGPLPPGVRRDGAHLLGGSAYLAAVHGLVAGLPPAVDLEGEWRVQGLGLAAMRAGLILAAQPCDGGGLAVAVARGSVASGIGATLAARPLAAAQPGYRWDVILFAERAARLLLAVRAADVAALGRLAASQNVTAQVLGTTGGTQIRCGSVLDVAVDGVLAAQEVGSTL